MHTQTRLSSILLAMVAPLAFAPFANAATPAHTAAVGIEQIPAVALSYDGQHLAWLVADSAGTRLELAGWNRRNPQTIVIPDDCRETGLRWSPRWYDLAVMTRCTGGAEGSVRSAIWVLDVNGSRTPRKIANIEGSAHAMQWSKNLKRIAFLYTPDSDAVQSVASVAVTGDAPEVITPANLDVHEFRLSRTGQRVAYTAVPVVGGTWTGQANLYVQTARAGATPMALVQATNPASPVHGMRISVPRWSAWDARVFFLAGPSREGSIGGQLYAVPASGGAIASYYDSSRRGAPAYWYTFMRNRLYMVTPAGHGQLAFSRYVFNSPGSIRSSRGYFTLPGMISDGRAPYAVSMAWRHWPRIAFAQASATQAPEVRSGLLTPSTPPVVTTINAGVHPAPADALGAAHAVADAQPRH
ncbi:MAG: TolB family protein [Rhodanobacteraceae bacterium]